MSGCPNEEAIDAFLEARTDPSFGQELEEHFDACAACGSIVTRLLGQSELTGHVPIDSTMGPGRDAMNGDGRSKRWRAVFADGENFGRYVILQAIGAGGMGRVYAAYDTSLDRRVALKFLADGSSDAAVARLLKEANAMAKLNHPNVVTIFDAGTVMNEPYIAMELVEGQTMAAWRCSADRSVREICRVMAATARGIAAAHAAGIVHRDIKPQNVLIAGDRVLVTDFGLSVTNASAERGLVGTPGYMAPEQFVGAPVDVRTDVFGFCATLYFMLHGVPPFQAGTLSELKARVLSGQVTPVRARRQVPARLHQLALQGLVPEPMARPTDLARIADDLLFDPAVRRRRVAIGAAVAITVAGAFAAGIYLNASPQRRCNAGAAAIAADWTSTDRAQLRQRFALANMAEAWPALEQRIDRYVASWRATRADTCSATFGKAQQSVALLDLRMMCLDGQRAWLGALVDSLGNSSVKELAIAGGVGLPDVSECSDVGRANQKPVPGGSEARVTATNLQERLDTATSDVVLGRYQKANAAIDAALIDARRLGYEPLIAEALFQRAQLEEEGKARHAAAPAGAAPPNARALYEEAYALAERSGADWIRLMVSLGLIRNSNNQSRLAEADMWVKLASALLARIGNPPKRLANLEFQIGQIHIARGQMVEARAALDRSLALRTTTGAEKSPDLVPPMLARCDAEPDRAVGKACYEKLLQYALATNGPKHPNLAGIYNNMSTVWIANRSTRPEACGLIEKALRIFELFIARDNRGRITLESNLADCLRLTGHVEDARRRLLELLDRLPTPSSNRMAVRRFYGQLLFHNGESAEAEHQLRLATAEGAGLVDATDDTWYFSRCALADLLLTTRRPAEALAEADRALAGFIAAKVPTPESDALIVKGRALLALGRPKEAIAPFEEALAWMAKNQIPANEQGPALLGLGQAEQALGDHALGLEKMERAAVESPAAEVDPEIRGQIVAGLAAGLAQAPLPHDRRARAAIAARVCGLGSEAVAAFGEAPKGFAGALKAARGFVARRCPGGQRL
jgi:tetratricopeptide (TPR) repeat protein